MIATRSRYASTASSGQSRSDSGSVIESTQPPPTARRQQDTRTCSGTSDSSGDSASRRRQAIARPHVLAPSKHMTVQSLRRIQQRIRVPSRHTKVVVRQRPRSRSHVLQLVQNRTPPPRPFLLESLRQQHGRQNPKSPSELHQRRNRRLAPTTLHVRDVLAAARQPLPQLSHRQPQRLPTCANKATETTANADPSDHAERLHPPLPLSTNNRLARLPTVLLQRKQPRQHLTSRNCCGKVYADNRHGAVEFWGRGEG